MGLSEFFIASVTSEDGMETLAQRFLSAAIKLGRPPDHCVAFVPGSLAGITAAHNCTMKARMHYTIFCHLRLPLLGITTAHHCTMKARTCTALFPVTCTCHCSASPRPPTALEKRACILHSFLRPVICACHCLLCC
jgi:hypothetical protein